MGRANKGECNKIGTLESLNRAGESFHASVQTPGLPDGIFLDQKSQFGYIFGAVEWNMLVYVLTF
jgi:hypothetical protein